MNDLTGAFIIAKEKNEDLVKTRQSLAHAGYPLQEIEEALLESKQILERKSAAPLVLPSPKKKSRVGLLFLVFFLIILGALSFFFWEEIITFSNKLWGN